MFRTSTDRMGRWTRAGSSWRVDEMRLGRKASEGVTVTARSFKHPAETKCQFLISASPGPCWGSAGIDFNCNRNLNRMKNVVFLKMSDIIHTTGEFKNEFLCIDTGWAVISSVFLMCTYVMETSLFYTADHYFVSCSNGNCGFHFQLPPINQVFKSWVWFVVFCCCCCC